ncbi:MAG: AAA family ATPase [Spirochaetaceae bacterium]
MVKTIAVASGKGGVGKTVTVTNLGIYAARRGLRVAIIDADPLSDIAELFDIPESRIKKLPTVLDTSISVEEYTLELFENLDLLFPLSKINSGDTKTLLSILKEALKGNLKNAYDLIILDLAAGADEEENTAFLTLADRIVLVTNPEPSSHVAAGTYLSKAKKQLQDNTVYLWHNRYRGVTTASFRPGDVIGNFNRNVAEEDRLDPEDFTLHHIAFVPDDASLDLLKGGVAANLQLLRNLVSSLEALHDAILSSVPLDMEVSEHLRMLLRFFLRNREEKEESAELLEQFGMYLRTILGIAVDEHTIVEGEHPGEGPQIDISEETPLFTPEQEKRLKEYFIRCSENRSRSQLLKSRLLLNKKLESLEQGRSLFGSSTHQAEDPGSAVDREISALLMFLEEEVHNLPEIKNHAALIMFYFSLYKLLQSNSVNNTLNEFVPHRKENGYTVRDRHTQILRLVQHSEDYRKGYLSLIRRLLPLVLRQVEVMSTTFDLKDIIFRSNGKPAKEAYAKLTSTFVHEVINSGLGVVVSFDHRPASLAFEKAAAKLLEDGSNLG